MTKQQMQERLRNGDAQALLGKWLLVLYKRTKARKRYGQGMGFTRADQRQGIKDAEYFKVHKALTVQILAYWVNSRTTAFVETLSTQPRMLKYANQLTQHETEEAKEKQAAKRKKEITSFFESRAFPKAKANEIQITAPKNVKGQSKRWDQDDYGKSLIEQLKQAERALRGPV